jgi:hypothetical protein
MLLLFILPLGDFYVVVPLLSTPTKSNPLKQHAFKIWWDNWKIEKNKYSDIREWCDLTKNKIKLLTMEISRSLNCKQSKKEIDRLERKLDKLKLIMANEMDEISAQIKQLEGLIKNYYNKKKQKRQI